MKKALVIIIGTLVYIGEIMLVVILLSAISSFFPEEVTQFIPESSNYFLIVLIYLVRLLALVAAVALLRREILHAKRDLANVKDYWFINI